MNFSRAMDGVVMIGPSSSSGSLINLQHVQTASVARFWVMQNKT